jgi:hypothetical protein
MQLLLAYYSRVNARSTSLGRFEPCEPDACPMIDQVTGVEERAEIFAGMNRHT